MNDPADFIKTTRIDRGTQRLFRLTEAEKIFLWHAFELTRLWPAEISRIDFFRAQKIRENRKPALRQLFNLRHAGAGGTVCRRILRRELA